MHSKTRSVPSSRKPNVNPTAMMKKTMSLTKLCLSTLNSLIMAMDPATTAVMKEAAPISSPTASAALLDRMDMMVLNKSGDPFPRARKVTPVRFSGMLKTMAMVWRFGEKKSLAAMPIVEKSKPIHRVSSTKPEMREYPNVQ